MDRRRILVTGGAGFIGLALVRSFKDTDVVVFDNFARSHPESRAQLDRLDYVTTIFGDILDPVALTSAASGCDTIVHCAAVAGVQAVSRRAYETLMVNGLGSLNVLQAARVNEVQRVVMLSTSEVYGANALDAKESDPTSIAPAGEPRWTYAASKLFEEHAALALHREGKIRCLVVRPFNVYGPGQVGDGAIRNFITAALNDADLVIRGSSDAVRSWCYIEDFTQTLLGLMNNAESFGRIVNLGDPLTSLTVAQLANVVLRNVPGTRSQVVTAELPAIDIMTRTPNVDLLRQLVPFTASTSLEDGIRKTRDWLSESLHDPTI